MAPFEKEVFQKTIKKFQTAWCDEFVLINCDSFSFARRDGTVDHSVFDLWVIGLWINHDDFVCINGRPNPI